MNEELHDFDWLELRADETESKSPIDGVRRFRRLFALLVLLAVCLVARAVSLEIAYGDAYRRVAARPIERRESRTGIRGRILARDGTVLARDRQTPAVAVHYRYLEEPTGETWLRRTARARLSASERQKPGRLAAEIDRLREEVLGERRRLAALCGLSRQEWDRRAATVQRQVERIARRVNQRHRAAVETSPADSRDAMQAQHAAADATWLESIGRLFDVLLPPEERLTIGRITVAEELDYHVMVEDVSLDVAAEIEAHADQYPSARILSRSRRSYPGGNIAAHVIGYLAPVERDEIEPQSDRPGGDPYHPRDTIGRFGVERQYERYLRGRRGERVALLSHGGKILDSAWESEPTVGLDIMLTLDPALQRTAESLLDSALSRRPPRLDERPQGGGAIVVMDIRRGEILAAASAPRFDPNVFSRARAPGRGELLSDPSHPLLDRVTQMTIPAGSVFKVASTVALLESGATAPQEAFYCQGYLHQPDRHRCLIFVRHGVGHGEVTLTDALARSCNVYFFHHAEHAGPDPLIDWAIKLGFGRPTGIDLPGEAAGRVPTPLSIRTLEGHAWRTGDSQAMSIGQGSLTVTPLQIARMMAAVANGGKLVTPRVVRDVANVGRAASDEVQDAGAPQLEFAQPQPIAELSPATLAAIREGLEQVVADPQGTAHPTVYSQSVTIAGKTGTAETGPTSEGIQRGDHAWFAGYAPADNPKVAFAIALEHAGSGATAAGPVARRLVLRMAQLGYFQRTVNSVAR